MWRERLAKWCPFLFKKKKRTFRQQRGKLGEDYAAKFLRRAGMKVLLRNWRHGRDEVDIVALEGDCLVFVEVKTRAETDWRGGYAAVNTRKRNAQKRAVRAYLKSLRERPSAHRFDIIEVVLAPDDALVRIVHHRRVSL